MIKFLEIPIKDRGKFITIDICRSETGGYCVSIGERRVAGSKPSLEKNNILFSHRVLTEDIKLALRRWEEQKC